VLEAVGVDREQKLLHLVPEFHSPQKPVDGVQIFAEVLEQVVPILPVLLGSLVGSELVDGHGDR
jgi:hypothetical protein